MIVKLLSVLQGREQGFEEYTKELEGIITNVLKGRMPGVDKTDSILLHQTAAQDGRLHTTVQINIY